MSKLPTPFACLPIAGLVILSSLRIGLAAQSGAVTPKTKPAISLLLTVPIRTVKAGNSIPISVTMKNTSDHETFYWRENANDPGVFEYRVQVLTDKMTAPPITKFGRALKGRDDPSYLVPDTAPLEGSGGWRTLKTRESITDVIDVSELYDLGPGKYSVQVRRLDEESKTFVASNTVILTAK